MCGEMGKAVLRALTGALLLTMVSDAAYLQRYEPSFQYESDNYYERPYKKPLREHEKPQDLSNVPGVPGVDYPVYHEVPETSFSCSRVPVHPGMYANVETGCQAYHVCHDGREGHQGASFLCTNGTLFDQAKFACDWWYNVDCSQAIAHYKLNADPEKNPYEPKKKAEEPEPYHGPQRHGNIRQHIQQQHIPQQHFPQQHIPQQHIQHQHFNIPQQHINIPQQHINIAQHIPQRLIHQQVPPYNNQNYGIFYRRQ